MPAMNVFDALRRGFDRAGFEADKVMRYNRVKAEAARLSDQVKKQTTALGERALELFNEGSISDAKIGEIAAQIADLRRRAQVKEDEAATIQAEAWPEPDPSAPATTSAPAGNLPAPTPTAPPSYVPVTYQAPAPVAADTKFCQNCGATLRSEALFCSRCGTSVKD